MCHGSLPTKLNWLQQWFRIKQDYCISFQATFFPPFFHFYFFPLSLLVLQNPAILNSLKSVPGFVPFPLLLLPLSWCCFSVINSLAVAPEVFNQDHGSGDDSGSAEVVKLPHSSPIQKQRHRKCSRKTKRPFWKSVNVSQLFWIFWSHSVHVFWLYYCPYTDLKMSCADCEITDRDEIWFFAHLEPL